MIEYIKPSITILTIDTVEPLCLSGPQAGDIGSPSVEDTSKPQAGDAISGYNIKSIWEE